MCSLHYCILLKSDGKTLLLRQTPTYSLNMDFTVDDLLESSYHRLLYRLVFITIEKCLAQSSSENCPFLVDGYTEGCLQLDQLQIVRKLNHSVVNQMSLSKLSHQPTIANNVEFERTNGDSTKESKLFFFST